MERFSIDDQTVINAIHRTYTKTKWIAQARLELAEHFPDDRLIITKRRQMKNPSSYRVLIVHINEFGAIVRIYGLHAYGSTQTSWSAMLCGQVSLILTVLCIIAIVYKRKQIFSLMYSR